MKDAHAEYWKDAFEYAMDGMGLWRRMKVFLSEEQRYEVGESLSISSEHQSLAFYTPPASDGYARQDREWKDKYDRLQKEFDAYVRSSEKAVGRLARSRGDDSHHIDSYGEVYRNGYRIT